MQVIITPEAQKQYKHLPKSEQNKIKRKLVLLEQDHLQGKKLSGKLSEIRSLKAWPYRILYIIKENKVVIVTIAHRQGVYSRN